MLFGTQEQLKDPDPGPGPGLTNNMQLHARAHFGLRGDLTLVGAGIAGLHIFYLQGPVFVGLLEGQKTLVGNEDRSEKKRNVSNLYEI